MTDPLGFPGYRAQLARAAERSGSDEAVRSGVERFGDVEAVAIRFDFRFLGGSMGADTGRRIAAALSQAADERRPAVSFVASGGCRMQEGLAALTQMQAIAAASERLRAAGRPHVSVLGDPTTGGVWASLASVADVILAVRGARVAFAGHRVRGTSGDPRAFSAEGKLAAGQADALVEPGGEDAAVAAWLALLCAGGGAPAPVPAALGATEGAPNGWTAVQRARAPERPRAPAYLDAYFEDRLALSGDRAGGADPGMLCGVGRRDGRAIAYVAQAGSANTPAGFRTAARVIRLASRLGLPLLTLIDTPGAANDAAAERSGIGPAIADCFAAIAAAPVPVTSLVIGEGGSGGALALAAPRGIWMTPDSYFAVIPPEPAASILKRPAEEAPALADALRLRPEDLLELGLIAGIARG